LYVARESKGDPADVDIISRSLKVPVLVSFLAKGPVASTIVALANAIELCLDNPSNILDLELPSDVF
jgi:hypothetical protein